MAIKSTVLVNAIFRNKRDYQYIENEDKVSLFFLFNQWASRIDTENANFFNKKGMDKAVAMDLWFDYYSDRLYVPTGFYANTVRKKTSAMIPGLDEKDMEILRMAFPDELDAHFTKQLQLKTPIEVTKLKKKKGSY